ncbi:MAG: tubulin-like doman-containing protein [Gracilibacteraceae bacterium]|jgi:hypothetical protein|nr:tubulin-like doman-containing protein [Gracilibacteraceae bacterium]
MPITPEQQARIDANFQRLDYMSSEGLLLNEKRNIVDQRFLLVGYGGTGGKALARLRELLRQNVNQTEIDAKVRFCAIDADHGELDRLVASGVFATNEVFPIPSTGARDAVRPGQIDSALRPWVNPRIYVEAPAECWIGIGAGAVRQVGRVLLSLQNAVTSLVGHLTAQVNSLLIGAQVNTKLNVFILTGIAGGTGSGIVIDATYIIRQICDNAIGGDGSRLSIAGYVFLPSAGPANTLRPNNHMNGYAALKEIDYHMTVLQRGERYQHDYAGLSVDQEDIFNFCTLIDGRADGLIFKDHDKVALNVAANSILDMMTAENQALAPGAPDRFLVTSALSNTVAEAEAFVAGKSAHDCPREANYRYVIVGYQRMTIPIKLLRLHAAQLLFQPLWDQHTAGLQNATQKAAQRQLNALGLDIVDGLRGRIGAKAKYPLIPNAQVTKDRADAAGREVGNEILANIRNFARTAFRDDSRGPAYTVNMLDHMYNELNDPDTGLRQLAQQANGRNDKEQAEFEWTRRIIDRAMREIRDLNSGTYEVMTEIIEQLKNVLDASDTLLTDTIEFTDKFRNTYEWSLVDISNGPAANQVIEDYLEDLVDPDNFVPRRNQFLEELLDRCAEWVAAGAGADIFSLKKFIQMSFHDFFGDLIDASLEDFLVKLFTGNKHAKANTGNPVADMAAIQQAVNQFIVTRLAESLPMASTGGRLAAYDQAAKRYLTFPSNAARIGAALRAALGGGYQYYPSTFDDSIVCLQVYTGIPAFLFSWAVDGQKAYEANLYKVGLHMNEGEPVGSKGNWEKNWRRFPALRADAPHEIKMRAEAEELFRRAEELGLTRLNDGAAAGHGYYLTLLQPSVDIDALRELIDFGGAAIDLPGLGAALREAHPERVHEKELTFANMVTTFHPGANVPVPADWYRGLAVNILRKRLEMMAALDGTLKVWEQLAGEVQEHNAAVERQIQEHNAVVERQARYDRLLRSFAAAWAFGFIREDETTWVYASDAGYEETLLNILRNINPPSLRSFAHYYAFQRYTELAPAEIEQMENAIREKIENETDEEIQTREKAVAERQNELEALRQLRRPTDSVAFPPAAADFAERVDRASGEDGLGQKLRDFYRDLTTIM